MKRIFPVVIAILSLVLCSSTCEKMEPGDYRDYRGKKVNLLGGWVLTEVQMKTAGVIESRQCGPESVMEFAPKGIGYTRDLSGEIIDSWHYETFRAAVTIYTNDEWENNRNLGEDDDRFEKGKTYYFHVVDPDTISSEERVSSNTVIVNFFRRFEGYHLNVKPIDTELYSPDTLIIMYDTEVGKDPLLKAVEDYGATLKYDYSIIPGIAITLPEGAVMQKAIEYFKKVKGVVTVERDRINHLVEPVKPRLEVM
ncbi:MAG: hypothetical protein IJL91_03845 [Bacteroidales bacterium]|nr:hypothetical protein [Bacteroidales bacterium]